jgi:general secretion pathway protein E
VTAPPATAAQFARISTDARRAGLGFGAVLAESLGSDVHAAAARCAAVMGLPCLDGAGLHRLVPAFDVLGFAELDRAGLMLARDAERQLWLVIDDPFDTARIDWAESRIAAPFSIALAALDEIRACLKRHEATLRAVESVLSDVAAAGAGQPEGFAVRREELSIGRIAADSSPVVRLVNSMLYDALKALASDVHLETDAGGVAIKYRIDGVLDAAGRIDDPATAEQVISRVKVLAELDIAEKRVPQDGRFQVRIDARDIDLRVSIMPAVHGEDAVIRILDKQRLADEARGLRFEALGFDATTIARLRRLSRLPYGLLLVTGPTGSGKTTTLYAALSEINTGVDKIVTIEDPVEYQLPGAVQIPVNEKRGLSFSRGLRSILRHDPDTIMVGEIRDGETAQIAVQAALTGHLVFTTVHANNVFDVIGRLLHIGVDGFNLVAALNAVVAQRLVRVVCSHCTEPDPVDLADRSPAERAVLGGAGARLMHGRGCGHCRGSGYRGRRAIAEILVFDDALRELIAARAPMTAVKRAARERGMQTMRQAGLALVAQGLTTVAELDRVSFAETADAS